MTLTQKKLPRWKGLLAQETEQSNFCETHEEEREENLFFASKSDASTKSNERYVDSGCTYHMTGDEKAFLSINNNITTKVKMGSGDLVDAKGKGTISINMKGCGKQIYDVLYVPNLEENFLSDGQLMENGYSPVFRDNYCKIYDKIEPNQVIVEVKMIKETSFAISLQCTKKCNCRWFMALVQKILSLEFSWFKSSQAKGHGARPS